MASFKKRWDNKQKKDAIKAMQNIIKLLESGQYVLLEHGTWPGMDGKQNFKITVKIRES